MWANSWQGHFALARSNAQMAEMTEAARRSAGVCEDEREEENPVSKKGGTKEKASKKPPMPNKGPKKK